MFMEVYFNQESVGELLSAQALMNGVDVIRIKGMYLETKKRYLAKMEGVTSEGEGLTKQMSFTKAISDGEDFKGKFEVKVPGSDLFTCLSALRSENGGIVLGWSDERAELVLTNPEIKSSLRIPFTEEDIPKLRMDINQEEQLNLEVDGDELASKVARLHAITSAGGEGKDGGNPIHAYVDGKVLYLYGLGYGASVLAYAGVPIRKVGKVTGEGFKRYVDEKSETLQPVKTEEKAQYLTFTIPDKVAAILRQRMSGETGNVNITLYDKGMRVSACAMIYHGAMEKVKYSVGRIHDLIRTIQAPGINGVIYAPNDDIRAAFRLIGTQANLLESRYNTKAPIRMELEEARVDLHIADGSYTSYGVSEIKKLKEEVEPIYVSASLMNPLLSILGKRMTAMFFIQQGGGTRIIIKQCQEKNPEQVDESFLLCMGGVMVRDADVLNGKLKDKIEGVSEEGEKE